MSITYTTELICPNCEHYCTSFESTSCFSGMLTHYTDGKIRSLFVHTSPPICQCPNCEAYLWVEKEEEKYRTKKRTTKNEREQLKEKTKKQYPEHWEEHYKKEIWNKYKIIHFEHLKDRHSIETQKTWLHTELDANSLLKGLEQTMNSSLKDEFHVRTWVWWKLNEEGRYDEELYRSNVDFLFHYLEKEKKGNPLMLAELLRNTKRFDECLQILSNMKKNHSKVYLKIKELAESGDHQMKEVE